MASWPAIVVWCSAATLEFVGKCVPVLDQIMDAAMAFIVPFIVSFPFFFAAIIKLTVVSTTFVMEHLSELLQLYNLLHTTHNPLRFRCTISQSTLGAFSAFGSFDSTTDEQQQSWSQIEREDVGI